MDARRLACLERIGIPVWVPRDTPPPPPAAVADVPVEAKPAPATEPVSATPSNTLVLGPGDASQLCICPGPEAAATPIAGDLARCLPAAPVWAWPGEGTGAMTAEAAVDERLFTEVVLFGDAAANALPGGVEADRLGKARVIRLPDLETLRRDPAARQLAWRTLVVEGLVRGR